MSVDHLAQRALCSARAQHGVNAVFILSIRPHTQGCGYQNRAKRLLLCHSVPERNPVVLIDWIPAFAEMTAW